MTLKNRGLEDWDIKANSLLIEAECSAVHVGKMLVRMVGSPQVNIELEIFQVHVLKEEQRDSPSYVWHWDNRKHPSQPFWCTLGICDNGWLKTGSWVKELNKMCNKCSRVWRSVCTIIISPRARVHMYLLPSLAPSEGGITGITERM
jgi:hypothetical protein